MKRILYLGYFIKKLDWNLYWKSVKYASKKSEKNIFFLIVDSVFSVIKYNISLLEYFQFHFYNKDNTERSEYAGTGYMYEYQLLMNPKQFRSEFDDKRIFLKRFSPFIKHDHFNLNDLYKNTLSVKNVFKNSSGKIVLKSHNGQCGLGVEVKNVSEFNQESLIKHLEKTNNNLVEEFIVQHPDIMRLSPSGLNTIRIFTNLDNKNGVDILGCRLRISIDSIVDNLAAGNVAATINEKTGIVEGPGVYSDITKKDEEVHPITGVSIRGFKIPYWDETIEMVRKAALHVPTCRSIGWDIAITINGPELIEGNHDWCKLVWQLPVHKGLKFKLENHKNVYIEKYENIN